jgi:hypothetical protein
VGQPGGPGNVDGTGSAARFYAPQNVAVDGSGNLYVADTDNSRICKGTPVLPSPPQFQPANLAGNAISASDSTGPDRQRFYRVVLFP